MERKHIAFRPELAQDQAFLKVLFASTRERELAALHAHPEMEKLFVSHQFLIQHKAYRQAFPKASFLIIEHSQRAIGRLYYDETATNLHIIDISLLPQFRGQGVGAHILTQVLQKAKRGNKSVHLQVRKDNPALRLYQRLGFQAKDEENLNVKMQWTPIFEGQLG